MKILFCGSFFPADREDEIWKNSKGVIVLASHVFQEALIDGWKANRYTNISLLTLPCIGSFPKRYKKIYFRSSFFEFNSQPNICGGFLNITLIKKISIVNTLKQNIKKWALQYKGDQKTVVIYGMASEYLTAAIHIKKKFPEIEICVIILDLPEYFDDKKDLVSRLYSYIDTKRSYSYTRYIDSYVLLTKHMADVLKVKKGKWMLLEGIYLPDKSNGLNIRRSEKNIILYTGKFDARFGLQTLLDAFMNIIDDSYELWLCGDGTFKERIIACSQSDNRIKYMGLLKRDEVLILQRKATILINPRQPEGEYTKYSFPSKTMEYMASGTPTIMYNLSGIPAEYLPYLIIVKDNTVETLKETIVSWCSKSSEELSTFGKKASEFILKNKNAQVQSKRIFDFINKG